MRADQLACSLSDNREYVIHGKTGIDRQRNLGETLNSDEVFLGPPEELSFLLLGAVTCDSQRDVVRDGSHRSDRGFAEDGGCINAQNAGRRSLDQQRRCCQRRDSSRREPFAIARRPWRGRNAPENRPGLAQDVRKVALRRGKDLVPCHGARRRREHEALVSAVPHPYSDCRGRKVSGDRFGAGTQTIRQGCCRGQYTPDFQSKPRLPGPLPLRIQGAPAVFQQAGALQPERGLIDRDLEQQPLHVGREGGASGRNQRDSGSG